MRRLLGSAAWTVGILAAWTSGCGGRSAANADVPARHLFDEPPVESDIPPAEREHPELFAVDPVWILDEQVPSARFAPLSEEAGEGVIWVAPLRFPVAGQGREVDLDRAGDPRAGRPLAAHEAPSAGQAVIAAREVRLRLSARDATPPDLSLCYPTSAPRLGLELLGARLLPGGLAPARELRLEQDSRRALRVGAPSRVAWRVVTRPGSRLGFAFGLQALSIDAERAGLRIREQAGEGCRFQLRARSADGTSIGLWESVLAPADAGRFHEAHVELGQTGAEPIELELSTERLAADGGRPPGRAPLAFWSEPVLRLPVPDPPPSILFLLLDTLRADRLGCYGWPRASTPNLDRLAAQGVRFADVTSAAPWTLPAHASLFTSSYATQHGLWSAKQRLAEEFTTLAEVLRARGYETAAFTEGGFVRAEFGFDQGFDRFHARRKDVSETFALARDWIERTRAPFFAFVQTYSIHTPLDPPPAFRERHVRPYAGRLPRSLHVIDHLPGSSPNPIQAEDLPYLEDLYDAEVAYADAAVGELLAFLEASGRAATTLVVVTSDHGEELGEHGHFDHGWSLYQDQLHVPLILRLPGRFEGGTVDERTLHAVDLAPTLAEVAGAPVPAAWSGRALQGPARAAGEPLATPFLTRRGGRFAIAIRSGDQKYIDYPGGERPYDALDGAPKLFDLGADPGETVNRWGPDGEGRWLRWSREFQRRHPARSQAAEPEGAAQTDGIRDDLDALGYGGGED